MQKEIRYVEIAIEVECDEGDMTEDGWNDHSRLDGLYEVMPDVIKSISMPYRESLRNN